MGKPEFQGVDPLKKKKSSWRNKADQSDVHVSISYNQNPLKCLWLRGSEGTWKRKQPESFYG